MNKIILRKIHLVNWYGFINRTIPFSENLTLISGEPGIGKSTICRTILNAPGYKITNGTIYFDDNRLNENAAINEFNTMGIIIDFIGGEPFLNIKLVKQICDYFEEKF